MAAVELAVPGAGGGVGAGDQDRAQVLGAGSGVGALSLAGALAVARADPGPGGQALGGAEHGDRIRAGLDQDGDGGDAVDAGDGLEQPQATVVLGHSLVEVPVEVGDAPVEVVVLPEQVRQDDAVGVPQGHRQGVAQPLELAADVAAEGAENGLPVEAVHQAVEDAAGRSCRRCR